MDFKRELRQLLELEVLPITDELTELAAMQTKLLTDTSRNAADISLQVEEIYEIIKDNDEAQQLLADAKKREKLLVNGILSLSDTIDHFIQFASTIPGLSAPAETIRQQRDDCLEVCGFIAIGKEGEATNSKCHIVKAAIESDYPFEHVAQVMQSGYEYGGKVIRKATVAVSKN